jgi:polar amino acid transport system substrate-binding protein
MPNNNRIGSLLVTTLLGACASVTAFAGPTLDRVRETGQLRLGFLPGAKPFTSAGGSGAEGYGAALCDRIAAGLKSGLGAPQLAVEWKSLTPENALGAVASGEVDVLCTPLSATLERRQQVSFSIPTFAGGVRAVVRSDAPTALRDVLEATPSQKPVWRGSPALTLLEKTRFGTVEGSVSKDVLASRIASLKLNTATVSVPDYASGIRFLLERKIDVFLAERDAVLAQLDDASRDKVVVLKRQMTHQPLSLAVPRGDDDFRLAVDTALTAVLTSPEFPAMYSKYFGSLDEGARTFFSWATPPQ